MSTKFLAQLLQQNEHIRFLMKQSADEISKVNIDIEKTLANAGLPPGANGALEKTEAVRAQLQGMSEQLSAVSQALQTEVRERTMIDHQMAAAEEQEAGARHAAFHDRLTALPNRQLLTDRLEHGIEQAKRYRWTLAVLFIDLDRFKGINDTYGHQVGDAVLQTVALRLRHTTRSADTVSRFGGDEFLCLLTQLHAQEEITMIARKILEAIQEPCDLRVGEAIIHPYLAASIGISVFPKDGDNSTALIKRADDAMYRAKENKSGFAFAQ